MPHLRLTKLGVVTSIVAAAVSAHSIVSSITADGVSYDGFSQQLLEMEDPPKVVGWTTHQVDQGFVSPAEFASQDITCHKQATPGGISANVKAGGTIKVQWAGWPQSHVGPIVDYLAKCDGDCSAVNKTSLKFFKIDEGGLDSANKLIANNHTWTVTIPSDIEAGNYVLRHEIIALHAAYEEGGAQNYPQCFNLKITGSSSSTNPKGVAGNELYTPTSPGIIYDLYKKKDEIPAYTIPGPALYNAKSKRRVIGRQTSTGGPFLPTTGPTPTDPGNGGIPTFVPTPIDPGNGAPPQPTNIPTPVDPGSGNSTSPPVLPPTAVNPGNGNGGATGFPGFPGASPTFANPDNGGPNDAPISPPSSINPGPGNFTQPPIPTTPIDPGNGAPTNIPVFPTNTNSPIEGAPSPTGFPGFQPTAVNPGNGQFTGFPGFPGLQPPNGSPGNGAPTGFPGFQPTNLNPGNGQFTGFPGFPGFQPTAVDPSNGAPTELPVPPTNPVGPTDSAPTGVPEFSPTSVNPGNGSPSDVPVLPPSRVKARNDTYIVTPTPTPTETLTPIGDEVELPADTKLSVVLKWIASFYSEKGDGIYVPTPPQPQRRHARQLLF